MILRKITCAALLAFAVPVFAADEPAPLPPKMEGKWSRSQNKAEVELIQMESPTKAKLKVVFWDGCTRRGETSAEFKDGTWAFVAPGGVRCEDIKIVLTPISEKNRFDGTFETNSRGALAKGTLYLEW
jgi:hypothetical protein